MNQVAPLAGSRLLTADEVAERWQVNRQHVYRLTRSKQIPTVHIGRYCRYRLEAVEAFERGGGTNGIATNPHSAGDR